MVSQSNLVKLITKSRLLTSAELTRAQKIAKHFGCSLTDILIGRGMVEEEELGKLLAKNYQVKYVNLRKISIPPAVLRLIPEQLAVERNVAVFAKKQNQISIAMEDPQNLELIEMVKKTIGRGIKIIPHVATSEGIKTALRMYQRIARVKDIGQEVEISQLKGESVVGTINQIMNDAVRQDSSDVHIEPMAGEVLIRLRIDGVLHDHMRLPRKLHSSLVARVKILSKLKLDEQRHPQDGRFSFETKTKEKISLRVSTTPTVYGEKVVMRILHDSVSKINLEEIGLLPEDQEIVKRVLNRTHGMFLVTGPTGSGKTTTLYTLLSYLNQPGVNIMTIEDPVENKIRRVNQIQVNPQINLDFAQGLRSVLRQDPDIIMVGEIRDKETAVIAVNAAITGHLVFSTVHANNSAGAIPRLVNLGVEPFLLASTLNVVVAQRLVRILCPKCTKKAEISPLLAKRLEAAKDNIAPDIMRNLQTNYEPKGCSACYYTGFRGRTGIFELLWVDDEIQKLTVAKAPSNQIWNAVRKKGAKTMLEDGLIKVAKGITTIDEVLRVISE